MKRIASAWAFISDDGLFRTDVWRESIHLDRYIVSSRWTGKVGTVKFPSHTSGLSLEQAEDHAVAEMALYERSVNE
jgi:hypothetical protein